MSPAGSVRTGQTPYNLKTTVTGSEARSVDGSLNEIVGENRNTTIGRKATETVKGKSLRILEKGETAIHGVLDDAATFDDPEDENFLKLKSAATKAEVMGNHVQRVEGGHGAMFAFVIRWTTRKNDELLKIMLGNDRAWKEKTSESLDEIRDRVDHGECCGYKADKENVHNRLTEIRDAVTGWENE